MTATINYSDRIRELREELGREHDAAAAILHRAADAGRSMTRDELTEYRQINEKQDTISDEIATLDDQWRKALDEGVHVGGRADVGTVADDDDAGKFWRACINGEWRGVPESLHMRAMGEGTGAAGGYLVPEAIANRIWPKATAAMVTARAGVRVEPLESGANLVPLQGGRIVPSWLGGDNVQVPDRDYTIGYHTLNPKVAASVTRISWQLIDDSVVNIAAYVEATLAEDYALDLDRVVLRGGVPDTDEPIGIRHTPGIASTGSIGTLHWDDLIDGVAAVRGRNYEPSAIVGHTRDEAVLAKLKEATTNAYLAPPSYLDGIQRLWSTQVDATEGGGSDESTVLVGDFRQVVLGVRKRFTLVTARERYADFLQTGLIAFIRADVGVMRPEALQLLTGVTAS